MQDDATKNNYDHSHTHHCHSSKHKLVLIVIILILMFGSFIFGFGVGRFSKNMMGSNRHRFMKSYTYRSSMFNNNNSLSYNANINTASLQGVVTAKNGNLITVIGNGTTNNVTTNSSTQYIGGNSVAINDTVIVVGEYNNNTFIAQTIEINP